MRTQMCTHTYSEAHAHCTYGRTDEGTGGRTDRQVILLLYFFNLDSQEDWIFFILANSAIRDEMPPYVAFHQGLHCLPKQYPKCKGLNDIYDKKSMNTQ